ncbi:MAG: hypothetical protein A2046_04745 [Bacteroidetes bacterium GWA2_30_7]|nr:MAG: hypothetical protein A2046_04745 [Bacteroidetes bacterium GWA2_30_7]
MYQNKTIAAIISVRLSSGRLPNKGIIDIYGKTLLERVVINVQKSKFIDKIIVATTTDVNDDRIEELCNKQNLNVYRGSNLNLVKRYKEAAEKYSIDVVVRVTGDNPLTSYEVIDLLIESHFKNNADYSKVKYDRIPIGASAEIISLQAFKTLMDAGIDLSYTEYMTYYFTMNEHIFKVNEIDVPNEFIAPDLRLTVDFEEDAQFVRLIYKKLCVNNNAISLRQVIEFIESNKSLININKQSDKGQKYSKQLLDDITKACKIR